MKKMKHIFKVLVLICLSMLITTTIAAKNPKGNDGMKTDPPPMEMTIMGNLGDHDYLSSGDADLEHVGGGGVNFLADTNAYIDVDYIYARATLQQWSGSYWISKEQVDDSDTNIDEVLTGGSYTVPSGYYYRVHSFHQVQHNGVTESGSLNSSYIGVSY